MAYFWLLTPFVYQGYTMFQLSHICSIKVYSMNIDPYHLIPGMANNPAVSCFLAVVYPLIFIHCVFVFCVSEICNLHMGREGRRKESVLEISICCLHFTFFSFYSFRRNRGTMIGRALGKGRSEGISLRTSMGSLNKRSRFRDMRSPYWGKKSRCRGMERRCRDKGYRTHNKISRCRCYSPAVDVLQTIK